MVRMLLWMFVVYIVWKIIEVYATSRRRHVGRRRDADRPESGFSGIEEADYEDVTPKPEPPEQKTPKSR